MKLPPNSERLSFRLITKNDRDFYMSIFQDEQTMTFYPHPFTDAEIDASIEKQLQRYHDFNCGFYILTNITTGVDVGVIGLTYQPVNGETVFELGYLLNRAHWHLGYGQEAGKVLLAFAKDNFPDQQVYSTIAVNNQPSITLAKRLGATFVKYYTEQLFDTKIDMALYKYDIK